MAFGLPVVATNVGTTPTIIKHYENGCLVKTENDWVDTLEALINNPELRGKLGKAARKTVINKYSQDVIKLQYLLILNELC